MSNEEIKKVLDEGLTQIFMKFAGEMKDMTRVMQAEFNEVGNAILRGLQSDDSGAQADEGPAES